MTAPLPPAARAPDAAHLASVPTLDELERAHVAKVYAMTHGHKGRTCELLGISRPTLERKLRKYGLSDPDAS